jgi:exonuclease III
VYFNSTRNSRNSRGVAVLISNQVEHSVLETSVDPQENALLMKLCIKGKNVVIGSIYGPNDNNCQPFFDFLNQTIGRWLDCPVILGGDWNSTYSCLPVHENPDVMFMRNIQSLFRSEQIRDLCRLADLSDPFRTLLPDARDFSYHPSGNTRKNRSRIDFFLISSSLYNNVESCSIAQGFCRRSFDHKPIFLSLKKRKTKGRLFIHDSTLSEPLAADVVKLAVYKSTLFSRSNIAGTVTSEILEEELRKLNHIEFLINRIVSLRGTSSGDANPERTQALADLAAELLECWNLIVPLEYLREFDRQVTADVFFEELVTGMRDSLVSLQSQIKYLESKNKRECTGELARLKAENFAENFDRICHLESVLNDLSEKFVSDRLGNFIKTDILNSEKMTPRFLRIAETQNDADLSVVKDNNGIAFAHERDRNNFIKNFYEDLYKVPAGAQEDFTGCIENFLGDLINHPVIRGCMLSEEESTALEAGLTIDELDEAVMKCNVKSAPGLMG